MIMALLSAFALLLNGCSLAKEDAQRDTTDTLIGAFITDHYLDRFDIDAYLKEKTFNSLQDSDVISSDRYEEPLYAAIDRNNSADPSDWDISFDGIKGLSLLTLIGKDENGEIFRASKCSDALCDVKTNVNMSDNNNETTLSATIYSTPGAIDKDLGYYTNYVYQTADDKIYTVPGNQGFSTSWPISEGENMSTTFSGQTDSLEKGAVKTDKTTVTIQFSIMYEPVKITLAQMNEENKLVKQEEFTPGRLPEKLTADKETAYFLIETEKKDPDGNIIKMRSIYEKEESEDGYFLETFYAEDNGIVAKQYTEIIWDN